DISVIGATTTAEYAKFIEKDGAFARRFAKLVVCEPSAEVALQMLQSQLPRIEKHHGIKVRDEAVRTAVSQSRRYITDRCLPDKALDLLDEAASLLRLRSFKESSVKTLELAAEDVMYALSERTGIPVSKLDSDECRALKNLEGTLQQRVIGQNDAVRALASAIRRSRMGVREENRPAGCFLLCGPTGSGKTELCRALAGALFEDEHALMRIDMSEFSEPHSVSRLIGAAPGYVGYEEGGRLTEAVRQRPYSMVLFDELEKASEEVRNLLLQIMEEGELSDSYGRAANFRNCVVVCTSNLGSRAASGIGHPLGFSTHSDDYIRALDLAERELQSALPAELINRFDEIALFRTLTQPDLEQIAAKLLGVLAKRMGGHGITVRFEESVARLAARCGACEKFGARPLKREIAHLAENALADAMLTGKIKSGDSVTVAAVDGRIELISVPFRSPYTLKAATLQRR
ncbi:MAG: ATP-dependent Clp protease ATP-binding subunit, partial [Oscillospiraceae bacterium]